MWPGFSEFDVADIIWPILQDTWLTSTSAAGYLYGSTAVMPTGVTLKEYESGAIVRYNYNTVTSCYWGGNAGQGVFRNEGGRVDVTKVDGATVKWQKAVDAMNTALQTAAGSEWRYELNGALPTLSKQ